MSRDLRLAKKYNGKEVAFKDLPRSHRLAIIRYMAIDGEAWESPEWYFADDLPTNKRTMNFYLKKYGDCKFGVVNIPTEVLKSEVMKGENDIGRDFKTFDEYHKWYISEDDSLPHYPSKNRWPCIMDATEDDNYNWILEDGWHRFHSYVRSGHKTIPCIYYLNGIKYS